MADMTIKHVDTYIYEMDRAGKRADLFTYLPFLKELIAYAKETSPSQSYSSKSIEDLINFEFVLRHAYRQNRAHETVGYIETQFAVMQRVTAIQPESI